MSDSIIGFLYSFIMLFFVGLLLYLVGSIGYKEGQDNIRREAVDTGSAYYSIEGHDTVFNWYIECAYCHNKLTKQQTEDIEDTKTPIRD